ncbi:MAG: hypothetical protein ACI9F2_000935 [Lysobacterales bacterium]|jgi:uncharacterized protein (TIGR02722 family)
MKNILLIMCCIFAVSGCTTTVKRVEVGERIDLSGRWNDYDAQLVAEEMVFDALDKPWRGKFIDDEGRTPVVIVGSIDNNTSEHINTNVFTISLERELLNSGDITFVASLVERDQIRVERDDQQQGNTDPATIAAIGREHGADFMLIGSVDSVQDVLKNKEVVLYQVSLELIHLTTNKKVWIGQKQIKKSIKNPRVTF